jgi:hypothetical protein
MITGLGIELNLLKQDFIPLATYAFRSPRRALELSYRSDAGFEICCGSTTSRA